MDAKNELQHVIVDSHVTDLLREGESLRTERKFDSARPSGEDDVGTTVAGARHHPARVRLGSWLSGVGETLAGNHVDDDRTP